VMPSVSLGFCTYWRSRSDEEKVGINNELGYTVVVKLLTVGNYMKVIYHVT
jgi:hypothetical protein